jgi:hypothetical protein
MYTCIWYLPLTVRQLSITCMEDALAVVTGLSMCKSVTYPIAHQCIYVYIYVAYQNVDQH